MPSPAPTGHRRPRLPLHLARACLRANNRVNKAGNNKAPIRRPRQITAFLPPTWASQGAGSQIQLRGRHRVTDHRRCGEVGHVTCLRDMPTQRFILSETETLRGRCLVSSLLAMLSVALNMSMRFAIQLSFALSPSSSGTCMGCCNSAKVKIDLRHTLTRRPRRINNRISASPAQLLVTILCYEKT